MPSPQTGVFVCKLLAHPPLLLASLPPASCLSQAFVAQMKDALPQYVSLTTPCPPSATWTRFSTERLLEFDFFVQLRKFLASKIFANTKPTFLHLYFHLRVWSNFDSWHLLRRYFCVLSIIIYIWICFSKSICICIPSQGTNDSVLAVDRPRPPGRHSRRHYWDAIVQPPALCVQPAPRNMLKRPHDWNPGTLCFPL